MIGQEALAGLLKKPNLRMTRQRMIILEELRKVTTHPRAEEVYEMVRKRLPRISLATVYRNLEILAQTGKIQKLEPGSSIKRFDGNPHEHHHIRCIKCDRVVDAPVNKAVNLDDLRGEMRDFKIIGYQLVFIGLCPECVEDALPA